jgi:hypothetical protein
MLTKRAAPPMRAPMATAAVGMAPALSSVALLAAAPALLEIAPALEVREAIWSSIAWLAVPVAVDGL